MGDPIPRPRPTAPLHRAVNDSVSEPTDDDPRICYCMHVHRGELVRAIADGAATLQALRDRTGASTGCGTCRIDLLELLAQHAGPRDGGDA